MTTVAPVFEARAGRAADSAQDGADIIAALKDRDPAAWSSVYDAHFEQLYRYAYARLGVQAEAEDIASQTFLEALRGIDSFEDRGRPVLAWLYRIARNLVVERLRREDTARRLAPVLCPVERNVPGPEGCVDSLDLLQALARLTPDQREVIILRFFLQLSNREVAAAVEKTSEAVASLQVRGLAALRRALLPG
jgi:RNA polymerase sigma-70 factor (ECF subfamily)